MTTLIKFYISCFLALIFGVFNYKKGLEKLKKWNQ